MLHQLSFFTTAAQLAGWQQAVESDYAARLAIDPKTTPYTVDELMTIRLLGLGDSYASQVSDKELAIILADAKTDPDVFAAVKAAREATTKVDQPVVVEEAQPGMIARAMTGLRNMFGGSTDA